MGPVRGSRRPPRRRRRRCTRDGVAALLEHARARFGGAASAADRSLHETRVRCCTDADNGWEPDEIPATLYLDASRPRAGRGRRHLAVFLGSAAALIALALTNCSATPSPRGSPALDVGRLALDRRGGVRRVDGDLGVRLAVRAHPLRRHGLMGRMHPRRYCTGSIVNALAPARIGTAVRFALFSRVLHNEGRLDGGRDRRLAERRAGDVFAVVLALAPASGVAPLADRGAPTRERGGGRNRVARARLPAGNEVRAHALDVCVLGRCPSGGRPDRRLGWARWRCVTAATGIAAAFGVDRPLAAAVLIIPRSTSRASCR